MPAHVEVIADTGGFAALQSQWTAFLEASGIFLPWERASTSPAITPSRPDGEA